jgi:hypothetical protein
MLAYIARLEAKVANHESWQESVHELVKAFDEHLEPNDYCGLEVSKRNAYTVISAIEKVKALMPSAPLRGSDNG